MTQTIPTSVIAEAIKALRAEYIAHGAAPSYYEINNGQCEDFAEEVLARLQATHGRHEDLFTVCNENFYMTDDSERWDSALLKRHWNFTLPEKFTWNLLNEIGFGLHVWLTSGGRHFDAECPAGVDSFFELPIFKRCLVENLRERGIPCPDVETDDVVPAPLCPVTVLAKAA
jgi:hypothetical protein